MSIKKPIIQSISHRTLGNKVFLDHSHKEDVNKVSGIPMEDYIIYEPDLMSNGQYAFFAILDGHGGPQVAKYVSENFTALLKSKLATLKHTNSIEQIIQMCLSDIERKLTSTNLQHVGSTFCAIFIDHTVKDMIIVNIGDSKLLQIASEENDMLSAGFLTTPHKANDFNEVRRIMMSGGMVFNGRVGGVLNMTRAIGDLALKKFGVISDPEIHRYSLDTSSLILLASDGIWDFIEVNDVLETLVTKAVTSDTLCDVLVKESIKKGSRDNISIICIVVE